MIRLAKCSLDNIFSPISHNDLLVLFLMTQGSAYDSVSVLCGYACMCASTEVAFQQGISDSTFANVKINLLPNFQLILNLHFNQCLIVCNVLLNRLTCCVYSQTTENISHHHDN